MTCDEVRPLLGAYRDSELDAETAQEVAAHLATCSECPALLERERAWESQLALALKSGDRTAEVWEGLALQATSMVPTAPTDTGQNRPTEPHSLAARSAIPGLEFEVEEPPPPEPFRRVFFRKLRRALSTLIWLAIALGLLCWLDTARSKQAWQNYQQAAKAKREPVDLAGMAPQPAFRGFENFASTPFFASLFDYRAGLEDAAHAAADRIFSNTNAFERWRSFCAPIPPVATASWSVGKRIDLDQWLKDWRKMGNSDTPATNADASIPAAAASVLQVLQRWTPVLDELREASQRSYSRFPIHYAEWHSAFMPHLEALRRTWQLLCLRGVAELKAGQVEEAYHDVELALRLADLIRTEPTFASQMARIDGLNAALQILWEGMATHQWNGLQLRLLQPRFSAADYLADARLGLLGERAMANDFMDRFRQTHDASLFSRFDAFPPPLNRFVLLAAPSDWLYWEQLRFNRFLDDQIFKTFDAKARRAFPGLTDPLTQSLDSERHSPLTRLFLFSRYLWADSPTLSRAAGCALDFGWAQTISEEAALACAMERYHVSYHQYPATLAEAAREYIGRLPADAVTGESFLYRRPKPEQFVLYSKGWNQADDGGQVVPSTANPASPDLRQGDWVWSVTTAK